MQIERAEYDVINGFWIVWGTVSLPHITASGVHTVEAPPSSTLDDLATLILAQYGG
jgi:hypothetical protein